jgi:hypothetical protein
MRVFPENSYRWLEMYDASGTYGHSAIRVRDDALELHTSISRWGPSTRREVTQDVLWLKKEAQRLGLCKIIGIKVNMNDRCDAKLFRFARLFGFTETCVIQTTSMLLD